MSKPAITKQTLRTEATRGKLLLAGYTIFIRDGFAKASLDLIARRAGYSRGALYPIFKDKEALFLAVYEQQQTKNLEFLRTQLEDAQNAVERARVGRNFYMNLANDQQWLLLTLEFRLHAIRTPKLLKRLERVQLALKAKFETTVRQIFHDGDEGTASPAHTMHAALVGILYGLTVESLFRPQHLSKDDVADILGKVADLLYPFSPPSKKVMHESPGSR